MRRPPRSRSRRQRYSVSAKIRCEIGAVAFAGSRFWNESWACDGPSSTGVLMSKSEAAPALEHLSPGASDAHPPDERIRAVTRPEERLRILAEATAVLGSTVDQQRILHDLAALVVPSLADWCTIDLLDDDGQVHRVGMASPAPSLREIAESWWRRFPPHQSDH